MLLDGKWAWIWEWQKCAGGDPVGVAERLKGAGLAGAFIKTSDGGHDYDQGQPIEDIFAGLERAGVAAIPWAYWYLADQPFDAYGARALTWRQEAENLVDIARRLDAQAFIIDVEAESENASNPDANARAALLIVKALLPKLAVYYAPLAQPNFHRRLPYRAFNAYCQGIIPQAYHNAMEVPPEQAIRLCYEAFESEGLATIPMFPAGGAYGTTTPEELAAWTAAAKARGATGVSYWSFQHIDDALWAAIKEVEMPSDADKRLALLVQIAGWIMSGEPALVEKAYMTLKYLRLVSGLPV
jgi:hypothetical protein